MSRLKTFSDALLHNGFDAAIISSGIHQYYLTDFDYHDGYVLVTNQKSYLLTDFRYEEAARRQASNEFEVLCPTGGMIVEIAGLLEENGCRRVAVEEKSLSLDTFDRLKKAISCAELVGGASAILDVMRVCKDDEEIEKIKRAQAITDAAFSHVLSVIHPSMTEIDVALELEFFMRKHGADDIAFSTIAVSGSESALPHGVPRPKKLERGFLTMDFGAKKDGYCSDMTRTVVIGKADAEMKRLYSTVLAAQQAALAAAHAEVSCHALDKVARDVIENAGYHKRFGHSLGHGVGMLIHEDPRLSPSAKPEEVLKRGHVVTVEPGIYLTGKYGCRIEDMIAVRADGSVENLTKSNKELIELF